jgi:hypothetical protein
MIARALAALFVLARSYADSIQFRIPRRTVVFEQLFSELFLGNASIGSMSRNEGKSCRASQADSRLTIFSSPENGVRRLALEL